MKFKVGDRVRWTDSTLGRCKGVVARLGGEAIYHDCVLFDVRVTSASASAFDADSDTYPVYESDLPEKDRGFYQRVDAGPSWGF